MWDYMLSFDKNLLNTCCVSSWGKDQGLKGTGTTFSSQGACRLVEKAKCHQINTAPADKGNTNVVHKCGGSRETGRVSRNANLVGSCLYIYLQFTLPR